MAGNDDATTTRRDRTSYEALVTNPACCKNPPAVTRLLQEQRPLRTDYYVPLVATSGHYY